MYKTEAHKCETTIWTQAENAERQRPPYLEPRAALTSAAEAQKMEPPTTRCAFAKISPRTLEIANGGARKKDARKEETAIAVAMNGSILSRNVSFSMRYHV